jgi:hypothetical protein
MKGLTLLAIFFTAACATVPTSAVPLNDGEISAFHRLLSSDWSKVQTTQVRELWPGVDFRSEAAGDGCEGSLSLIHNTAEVARTFVFNRERDAVGCVEQLSAVSFELRVKDRGLQQQIGDRVKSLVARSGEQTTQDGNGYTVVSWPAPSVNQTTRFSTAGEHVRFSIFRVHL